MLIYSWRDRKNLLILINGNALPNAIAKIRRTLIMNDIFDVEMKFKNSKLIKGMKQQGKVDVDTN